MEIKIDTVHNCDCRKILEEISNGGGVLISGVLKKPFILTDVPYGIGIEKMGFTKGVNKHGVAYTRDYSSVGQWDKTKLDKEYFDLMFKCSKEQIIFGGNYYTDILPPTKSWIVWDKRLRDKTDRNDFGDCELAWCSKGVARVFHYLWNGMLQENMKNKQDRIHPTEKPVGLLCQLLDFYTADDDIILDPFAGSLTTAIACHKMQRHYICVEMDKEYYEKGMERLNAVKSQMTIWDL